MQLLSTIVPSPIWDLFLIAHEAALIFLDFLDAPDLDTKKRILQKFYSWEIRTWCSPLLEQTETELTEYFAGTRRIFSIPLEVHGTIFQEKSWQALQTIPYGETRNYLEQATMIGNSRAVRAIGGANHMNPISIIIPCHRVIGKNKSLTGYGWGIERKRWLLEHEKKNI